MNILLLKLFLAPLLVVTSTLAGRRWGPDIAGTLVGLPIVAGPILFITYLQHGADFASAAAGSALFGLVALAAFTVVFARAAQRFGWPVTLAVSWIAVLAVDAALSVVHVTALVATAVTLAATAVALRLMPKSTQERQGESKQPLWDLPGRAVATAVLVLTVTTASGALGPHWTGLLAPFPIATSVVAAFVLAQHGPSVTARTLTGVLLGLVSFAVFCLSVALLIRPVGGVAFLIGTAITVCVALACRRISIESWPARRASRAADHDRAGG